MKIKIESNGSTIDVGFGLNNDLFLSFTRINGSFHLVEGKSSVRAIRVTEGFTEKRHERVGIQLYRDTVLVTFAKKMEKKNENQDTN